MKVMVFAAGIGSRLKPFTDNHPKALLPVGGIPMLQRVHSRIAELNPRKVVVNVHHFASQIIEYLDANKNFGLPIIVSDESSELLDTGGGLLKARTSLDDGSAEPILLHNADILTDVDFNAMLQAHIASGADVTLLMGNRDSSRLLYFDNDGRLKGWRNLSTGETIPPDLATDELKRMAFSGVHIVNPSVFPLLEEYSEQGGQRKFSITPFYLANIGKLDIRGYTPAGDFLWYDVGTPQKVAAAEEALRQRNVI